MKRLFKMLFVIIMAVVNFAMLLPVDAASTAPSTITMGYGTQLDGYVSGTHFSTKVTNDGKFAYCTDITKKTPNGMKMTLVESKDAGLSYIIENGYPKKSFTGNKNYDYYITQSAVWWYLDDTTGSSNLSSSFKNNGSDPHGLRPHIKKLVNDAKNAKSEGYDKPSVSITTDSTNLTLSADEKYYYSSNITIKGKAIEGNITLSLSDAPSGAVIVDTNNQKVTSVKSGTVVKIRIPAENIDKLEDTMTIKAAATGVIYKSYMYKPSNSSYQPVIIGVLFPEYSDVSTTKKFTLKSTKVEIIKVDSETGKPLAGAKMQLQNSKGEVVAEWTTTDKAYTLKNIKEGTYKLIEKEAPKGYTLNETIQEVVVKAGVLTKVTFYNTKKEPTKVVIIKRDAETNEVLEGAVFVLKDANGKEITTWTSTKNGHYVSGLPEGDYTIEELNAPEGYIKTDEVQTVKLEAGKTVTVTFYNKKEVIEKESILRIVKINGETGERLAGATLQLEDENGNVLYTWETTTEEYVINDIKPGKYYLYETKAPEGFVLSDEIMVITVTEDGGDQIVTFFNTPFVEVPDTADNKSILMIIVGIVTLTIGGSIIYTNLRQEEE